MRARARARRRYIDIWRSRDDDAFALHPASWCVPRVSHALAQQRSLVWPGNTEYLYAGRSAVKCNELLLRLRI